MQLLLYIELLSLFLAKKALEKVNCLFKEEYFQKWLFCARFIVFKYDMISFWPFVFGKYLFIKKAQRLEYIKYN